MKKYVLPIAMWTGMTAAGLVADHFIIRNYEKKHGWDHPAFYEVIHYLDDINTATILASVVGGLGLYGRRGSKH
jgi:hypothetical protein